MKTAERRYDIDWVRVIAIGLLLFYHIGIAFQPFGVFIGFIQSDKSLESLWVPMSMMNVWRIPLLFFVSGMGVRFAIRTRNWNQLILERAKRILVPFLFGVLCIVPIHVYMWQKYYNQDLSYALHPVHLWFLANIFIYVILLSPVFFYLKLNENGRIHRGLKKLFKTPLGLILVVAAFVLEAILVNPETFETYAMSWHGFLVGLLAFLFGFIGVHTGENFWNSLLKWRWLFIAVAVTLFVVRYIEFQLQAPNYLKAIESNMWIFAVFGFAYKYLNRPSKALSYLSQAAYPVYILHMIFLYLGSMLIMPVGIPAVARFIFIVIFTITGCFVTYEFIIRRIKLIRPLFGLKTTKLFVMKKSILLFSLLSLLFVSCEKDMSSQWAYNLPENINDGIEVGTLEEVHLDTNLIAKAVGRIYQGKHKEVHSMLIFKDNKLVLEEYFQGHKYQWDAPGYYGDLVQWDRDMSHLLMSCTKSFTSACIGIAIEHGFIENVNQSIFDYLPDYQHLKTENREYITIEHLLTMTSGLAWNEWGAAHGTSANDIDRLYLDCDDPVSCVLVRPWWSVPGTSFTYNGGGMVILAEILKNAANMNIDEFSMKYLFKPLGIDSTLWTQYENGMFDAAGSLSLSPRDMLKFGVTYLNDGSWNGEQIISSQWVENSSKVYKQNAGIKIPLEDSGKNGYAYSWWTSEFSYSGGQIKMYRANGWGGQAIMVFPDLNMVLVFTGGNYSAKTSLYEIVERFVLPAIH